MGVEETLEDDGVEVGLVGVEEGGVGAAVGMGPVYFSPSSPGENTTTEQNPSVDVMSKVLPSGDLNCQISMNQAHPEGRDDKPCKIGERRIMQVADNAKRRLLLGVIYQNRILCRNGIHNPIRE